MPGFYEICPVCFWEDDGVQFRWPTMADGANKTSLRRLRPAGLAHVRAPAADEPLDPAWRPIDPARDSFEDWDAEERVPWPEDRSVLCWWLPTFWRRDISR